MAAEARVELKDPKSFNLLRIRLGVGLAQGVALFALKAIQDAVNISALTRNTYFEPEPSAPLFGAFALIALFLPPAALGALGTIRERSALIWIAALSIVLAGLGAVDGFVSLRGASGLWPSSGLIAFVAVGTFVAHELVTAADLDRRRIATYERYFDEGWKDGVRAVLSGMFVGVSWLLLWLGALLFDLIGLRFLRDLLGETWFAFPALGLFFAFSVHVTDVRASLVRGTRTIALTLLSFLLPVMTLMVAGFLAALPFTGLQPLWETRHAGAILLGSAAALIILVNAAYQDGEREEFPPAALEWSARIASMVVAPLVIIAAYGIWLRVRQYGLSPDRVSAIACTLVAACYAVGYIAAALPKRPWLKRIEVTNVAAAHLIVALLVALFSPLADARRLSVGDQVRRLEAGLVRPEHFDYRFLQSKSGRYGRDALNRLVAKTEGLHAAEISRLALVAKQDSASAIGQAAPPTPVERSALVKMADGAKLPASFLTQTWPELADPLRPCANDWQRCTAAVVDLNADGTAEIILFNQGWSVFEDEGERWVRVGGLAGRTCGKEPEALMAGRYRVLVEPAPWRDVEIDGNRMVVQSEAACPPPIR
ncbi:DUF4153 domain-containing protein [Phenylobacterium sp.]|uniref:DUF4153 domain-containing protein n=1 Tax=Phenylobacterium sp. TaxID=1871053 RepID=UPI002734D97E|nr:DUF4153 domain-containing protein [Phenylobacterium sp.]MDP3660619.1 DUF4153 domain-containing protein [Phenylobacterium sp.]